MTDRIIRALRAVPRVLLPLVPMPLSVAAALSLWFLVNIALHGVGGSIS
jgi:hypothetical protein